MPSEAQARLTIDRLLEEAGWRLVPDARGPRQAVASSPINAEVHRRYPPSATDAKNSGKSSGLRKRKV